MQTNTGTGGAGRRLLRLVGLVLAPPAVALLALLVGLACYLAFLPSDLLRRGALPLARQALNHPNLQLDGLHISLASGVELRGLWLGPPAGYTAPLLSLRRLELRWDLSRVLDGEIRVRKLHLERPVVRVEQRHGKLNWVAFLDGLPKSKDPPKEEPKTEPSPLKVWLDRVAVLDLGAVVDDGNHRVVLDRLDIGVHGLYSALESHLHVALDLASRKPDGPSLVLQQRTPLALLARLDARLALDARVRQLHAPTGKVALRLDLATKELRSPWMLAPARLGLELAAGGDLPRDRAALDRLALDLNGTPLLRLSGKLQGLGDPKHVDLLLKQLQLPLTVLAPYARALVPDVDFGGVIAVRDLRVAGPVADLKARKLPDLRARVAVTKVWARLDSKPGAKGGAPILVRDLDLWLDLASAAPGRSVATTQAQLLAALPTSAALLKGEVPSPSLPPPAALVGRIRLGRFSGFGAQARGLDLALAAGVALRGLNPGRFAARLRLRLPGATLRHKAVGQLRAKLGAELQAVGDLSSGEVTLDRLALRVSDLVKLRASGRVEGWGKHSLRAKLELQPLDLEQTLAWLPAKLRAPLVSTTLRGRVGLKLQARGRLPAPGSDPLRAPLTADARLSLARIFVHRRDPAGAMRLAGLNGAITLRGKPTDLRLSTRLKLSRLAMPGQQLTVSGLELPLSARVTPRMVQAKLELTTRRAELAGATRLDARGAHATVELRAALPTHRLIKGRSGRLGRTSVTLSTGFSRALFKVPHNEIHLANEATRIKLDYLPGKRGKPNRSTVALQARVGQLTHVQQKLKLRGLRLAFNDANSGAPTILLPKPKLKLKGLNASHTLVLELERVEHGRLGLVASGLRLDEQAQGKGFSLLKGGKVYLDGVDGKFKLKLGSLAMAGVLDRPLRNNTVEVDLSMGQLHPIPSTFKLRRVALRVPSRGIYADVTGHARDLFPLSKTRLPPFDLNLSAGVANRPASRRAKATFLWPNIRGAGKLGLQLRLRPMAADRLRLDGKLLADDFSLWVRSRPPKGSAGPRREGDMVLRKINARLPVAQEVMLALPRWWLPKPRRLISRRGASVLYNTMRPYRKGQASFTLGGLKLDERIGATRRTIAVDRVALDLAMADNALRLSRMYVKLFGGDIVGALQAQLLSIYPLDPVLMVRTQITGVNLGYLDPEVTSYSPETEVSAMVDLSYRPRREELAGRINITRLSLKMLDSLLAYIDPDKTNAGVQQNRKLINAWYIKWVDPKVKLVSIWISHGNLNMDIELDAWAFVGTLLKRITRDMRIRRVNILPLLRQNVAPHFNKLERSMGQATGLKTKNKEQRPKNEK